jgi:hypothetical protein
MKISLWECVNWMLNESDEEDLLLEPDELTNKSKKEEQSVVGAVAGATLPLGATATFPSSKVKPLKKK